MRTTVRAERGRDEDGMRRAAPRVLHRGRVTVRTVVRLAQLAAARPPAPTATAAVLAAAVVDLPLDRGVFDLDRTRRTPTVAERFAQLEPPHPLVVSPGGRCCRSPVQLSRVRAGRGEVLRGTHLDAVRHLFRTSRQHSSLGYVPPIEYETEHDR